MNGHHGFTHAGAGRFSSPRGSSFCEVSQAIQSRLWLPDSPWIRGNPVNRRAARRLIDSGRCRHRRDILSIARPSLMRIVADFPFKAVTSQMTDRHFKVFSPVASFSTLPGGRQRFTGILAQLGGQTLAASRHWCLAEGRAGHFPIVESVTLEGLQNPRRGGRCDGS